MAKWTFEQQAAIELRGANLLISAAAGSGKTAVLVERITRLIQSKEAEIHKLLIVTYTNAAASEMRERIESALSKAIESGEGDAVYLNEQIKLLGRASIKTFHAFCLDVIRNHFQKIDCDPGFKMLGEPERVILVRQAIEEVLEMHYQLGEPEFLDMIDAYSGNRSDDKLIDLILQTYYFIQSQAHPVDWLNANIDTYSDPNHPLRMEWTERLRISFIEKLEGAIHLLENAIELCAAPGGPEVYIPTFESDLRGLNRLLDASDDMETFAQSVLSFKFDRIASIKKNEKELYDADIISEVKDNIRDKIVKKQVFESIKGFFEYKSLDRFQSEIDALKSRVDQLCHLTMAFSEQFQMLKKKKNLMDFNDLEHYAIHILEDQAICDSLQKKYDFIFVDEYQDSSGIQEHILSKISKPNNVFMVGDVKQSIYKFRLADPELFIEKYKRFDKLETLISEESLQQIKNGMNVDYSQAITEANIKLKSKEQQNFVRIDLRMNFRTRGEVLNTINHIFENIMSEKLGEIEYDADARLYPGMTFEPAQMPCFEINILSKKELIGDPDSISESQVYETVEVMDTEADEILKTEEFEANAIAAAIKSRIGTLVFDPKAQSFKPCTYRDIVVLLRSSRSWTPIFEQVFLESGIPLFADSSTGYFDTLEIKMVMSLLRIIDNPLQDLALLTVLRSPMVGLSIEEILAIKAYTPEKKYFYYKCIQYLEATNSDAGLKHKLEKFLSLSETLRQKAEYLALDALVWLAIQESNFYYYVSAMPGGVSRQANLKLLVDRATALKGSRILTLSHFIEFVDKMSTSSGDFGVASVIGETDNVVRLMSIHKSKGLEFPIVMISGLGRKFNFMDAQGDLIQHKRLGLGISQVDLTLRTKSKTLPQFVIRDQIRKETLSEEMRVLYVGLTRPVDQLVLFATVSDYSKKTKQWTRGVDLLSLSSAGGFIDWIMPALVEAKGITVHIHDQETLAKVALKGETIETLQVNKWANINQFEPQMEETIKNEISDRLSFNWVADKNAYKPLKISVSDKKKELLMNEQIYNTPVLYDAPSFLKEELPLNAAEVGTAIHLVLEKINFKMTPNLEAIKAFISTLVDNRHLTQRESLSIDVEKIFSFLNSNLVTRLRHATAFYRETPFVLKMDGQFVQGIIDIYFEEMDGLVLVDYKSDKVTEASIEDVALRYKGQIDIYRDALEKLTHMKVKEQYIYFIDADRLIEM